jgi:hypothetical protein
MELANSVTASGWKRHTKILAVVLGIKQRFSSPTPKNFLA